MFSPFYVLLVAPRCIVYQYQVYCPCNNRGSFYVVKEVNPVTGTVNQKLFRPSENYKKYHLNRSGSKSTRTIA